MTYNAAPTTILPGICNAGFCVHPSGSTAFLFDRKKPSFVRINFKTGQQTLIKTELPKILDVNYWRSVHFAVLRSSKLYICSLFRDFSVHKNLLVSFSVKNGSISIVDQHYIDINAFNQRSCYFQQIEQGQFFFVSYFRNGLNTIFDAAKIDIDERGKLSSEIIVRKRSLNGCWFDPFIHNDELYWLPRNRHMLFRKILRVWLNSEKTQEISTSSNIVDWDWPNFPTIFSFAQVVGHQVFCYTIEEKNKFGVLLILDMQETCWRKVSIEADDHIIANIPVLRQSENGFLCLHINCCAETCKDKAHIFKMDVRKELEIWTYSVTETVLGSGAFGMVVKGTINDVQTVAIKIFDLDVHQSQEIQKNVLESAATEAKNLKKLNHVNIVKGYGYRIESNRFLLFMEEMKESVRQKILQTAGRKLDESEALHILQQALEGLVYLHTFQPKPIVHRDIKCANMLLDENGIVKLGDFGLVNAVALNEEGTTDSALATNDRVGTRFWQAPEVLDSRLVYGRKADVWSLGCSLVEMLTGSPPYYDLHQTTWVLGISRGTLSYNAAELVPSASNNVIDILQKCFVRPTKQDEAIQGNSMSQVRLHSWAILADVIRINELLPYQVERKEEIGRTESFKRKEDAIKSKILRFLRISPNDDD